MGFEAFVRDIENNGWNVFGVEAYRNGKLSGRYGDTDECRHPIYSATKTVTSIAVGMAIDEGRMELDKPMAAYLPVQAMKRIPEEQRAVYRHLTAERLLTMSVAGYPFRPSGTSWLEEALNYPIPDADQRIFSYSNISAYLVGVAVSCALDEDLYGYLERRLFTPLGIVRPPYVRCPDGYFYGASGMELTVNELSRIGLMLMDEGMFQGERILSGAYIRQAVSLRQMNREGGYGYFVWKYRDGFSINGKWGQKCFVLPKQKMMVTYLSHIEEKLPQLRKSLERNILDEVENR